MSLSNFSNVSRIFKIMDRQKEGGDAPCLPRWVVKKRDSDAPCLPHWVVKKRDGDPPLSTTLGSETALHPRICKNNLRPGGLLGHTYTCNTVLHIHTVLHKSTRISTPTPSAFLPTYLQVIAGKYIASSSSSSVTQ